ncbi:MAG: globin family protein [Pseudomonadota bacterium]
MIDLPTDTIATLRESWLMIAPHGVDVASIFYQRLFDTDPSLKALFASTDMAMQNEKLIGAIAAVMDALDDLSAVVPVLEKLGRRHAEFGVTRAQYDMVGSALLWTFAKILKDAFTSKVRSAWTLAYAWVARIMADAAELADSSVA